MKRNIRFKWLNRLIGLINAKLNDLPESHIGLDFIFFYPDEQKNRLSDLEFKTLIEKIEINFEDSAVGQFKALLSTYMDNKEMTARELYNTALVEKSYFYQILSGKHLPSRDVTIRICLALKLNLYESNKLLQSLGYVFYERNRRDIIIVECIRLKVGLYTTEIILDKYGELSLCNKAILHNKDSTSQ